MPATATKQPTRFRSSPARGVESPLRVDREKGIIYGYSVATIGEAQGHGVLLDATTLEQIETLGNATKGGKKSRFTHPGLSSDGLGKFLGRSKNFRRDGNRTRADLHLSETAYDTPHGDLATYVMDLAEADPDAFGASVVVEIRREEQRDEEGKPKKDADGNRLMPLMRVKRLFASDIVDDPAANEGLFSALDTSDLPDWPAREASRILDALSKRETPEQLRGRVNAFLDRYFQAPGEISMSTANPSAPAAPPAAPAQPAPTAPAASATATEAAAQSFSAADVEAAKKKAVEEALAASKERATKIAALCEQAGMSELASDLIGDEKLSVVDVQAKLFEALAKKNKPVGDGGGASAAPPKKDPDEAFREEYRKNPAEHARFGVSEEDYVKSRRITEGLAPLQTIKTA